MGLGGPPLDDAFAGFGRCRAPSRAPPPVDDDGGGVDAASGVDVVGDGVPGDCLPSGNDNGINCPWRDTGRARALTVASKPLDPVPMDSRSADVKLLMGATRASVAAVGALADTAAAAWSEWAEVLLRLFPANGFIASMEPPLEAAAASAAAAALTSLSVTRSDGILVNDLVLANVLGCGARA